MDDYLEATQNFLQNIQLAFTNSNFKTLPRVVHTMSSSSATLGATNLAALCAELEIILINQMWEQVEKQIDKITDEYQNVKNALIKEREKY
ncbi:MAG: Hpt domain-containing protein [Nostocales cyanobacterium 94392]|nr:Hpt domain-containing protein [Nostocales cyanobacterium 94392]